MAKRNIPVTEAPANPAPSLTPDALMALLAEVQALREAVAAKPVAPAPAKTDQSAQNAWLAQKAFAKKGFKDNRPGETILTFNKWTERGFRPKEGETALKINQLRLFHQSQCRVLTPDEVKVYAQKAKEREAKYSGKVVPMTGTAAKLPPVTLVPQEPKAAKKARKAAPIQPTA